MFDDFKPRTYQEEKSNFTKPLYVNKNLEEKIISEPKSTYFCLFREIIVTAMSCLQKEHSCF